ncbi:MAG: hypothetical protein QF530_10930 [SAR202 cluster bacterium]|jgi:hypothetical protein|nr:hypothetical protein [SAR202 cluster bacterium]
MHSQFKALLLILPLLLLLPVGCSSKPDSQAKTQSEWQTMETSRNWWMSVLALANDDQWIVGGTPDRGKILHYNGSEFKDVTFGGDVELLNWIHRFQSGEIIVVGNGGAVLLWDGQTWTRVPVPTEQDLWGVWGMSPSDVWAVGGNADESGVLTVLRDTGNGFESVDMPVLERPFVKALFKVWGSGADDVYMVGQNGVVLHWNGEILEELHLGVSEDLIAVWGTGPNRVAIVGGRRNGAVVLWNGNEWRRAEVGNFPGLNGVWLRGDIVHVVGNLGTAGIVDFTTGAATRVWIDTPVNLHAIYGSPDGILIAVGGNFFTGKKGPFTGEILTRPLESSE